MPRMLAELAEAEERRREQRRRQANEMRRRPATGMDVDLRQTPARPAPGTGASAFARPFGVPGSHFDALAAALRRHEQSMPAYDQLRPAATPSPSPARTRSPGARTVRPTSRRVGWPEAGRDLGPADAALLNQARELRSQGALDPQHPGAHYLAAHPLSPAGREAARSAAAGQPEATAEQGHVDRSNTMPSAAAFMNAPDLRGSNGQRPSQQFR